MCFHSLLTLVTSVLVAARPFQGYLALTSSTPATVEKITAWRSEIDAVQRLLRKGVKSSPTNCAWCGGLAVL